MTYYTFTLHITFLQRTKHIYLVHVYLKYYTLILQKAQRDVSLQVRCMLNIWGVMLFIRLSWVFGQAGIGEWPTWPDGSMESPNGPPHLEAPPARTVKAINCPSPLCTHTLSSLTPIKTMDSKPISHHKVLWSVKPATAQMCQEIRFEAVNICFSDEISGMGLSATNARRPTTAIEPTPAMVLSMSKRMMGIFRKAVVVT